MVTDVFREHYAKLVRAITEPSLLAADLFSANLISETVMTNAGNAGRATITIMSELRARFNSDPKPDEVMRHLLEVMRQYPALQSVAMSIREALGE